MGEGFLWKRINDEYDTIAQMGLARQRARERAQTRRPNTVSRLGDLRKTYGWVKPGALWSLARAGVDATSDVAKQVADASASVRNRKGDWAMPGDPVGPASFEPEVPGTGGRGRMGVDMEPRPLEEEVPSFREFREAVLAAGEMERRQTSSGTRVSTSEDREAIALGRDTATQWRDASKEERRAFYDAYVKEQTGKKPKADEGESDLSPKARFVKKKIEEQFGTGGGGFSLGDLPDLGKRIVTDYNPVAGVVRAGQAIASGRAIEAPGAVARGLGGVAGRASDVGRERVGAAAQETGLGDPVAKAWNETFGKVVKPLARGAAVAANFPYEYGQALFRGPVEQYQEAGFGLRSPEERRAPLELIGQELSETQAGQVGKRLLAGERVDLGTGYLPGMDSDIVKAQAEAARERGTIAGHAITPGRWLANQIFEPDTQAFDILSGVTDGAVAIYGDPTNLVLGGSSRARAGSKLFAVADEGAAVQKTLSSKNGRAFLDMLAANRDQVDVAKRLKVDPTHPVAQQVAAATDTDSVNHILRSTPDLSSTQVIELAGGVDRLRKYRSSLDVDEWLTAPPVRALDDKIAETSSPYEIRTMLGPSFRGQTADGRNLFTELAATTTGTEVDDIWRSVAGVGVRETPSVAAGRSGLDPRSLGYQFRRATKDVRALGMVPSRFMVFDNLDETVENLDRYLLNARVPEVERAGILDNLMLNWNSKTSRYQTITAAMDATAVSMKHAGVPDNLADELTRFVRREGDTGRRYVTGSVAEGPVTFDGVKVGDELVDFRYKPHDINETLNTGVMLPDPRSVRRATAQFKPLMNLGLVKAGTTLADHYMGVWRRSKLARPAWGVRVIGEEQARIAAVGLQGLYNHPVSALAWIVGTPNSTLANLADRLDRGLANTPIGQSRKMTAGELDQLDELAPETVQVEKGLAGKAAEGIRKIKAKRGRGMFLPNGEPFMDDELFNASLNKVGDIYRRHEDWVYQKHFDVVDRLSPDWEVKAARGLGEDYARLSSGTMRQVIDAPSPAEAKAWFWEGDGSNVRRELAKENHLAPLENQRAFSDAYIDSMYERLDELTGMDPRLVEALRHGRIGGKRLTDGSGQLTNAGEAEIKKVLDEGVGPQRVKAQRRMLADTSEAKEGREYLDRTLNAMFEAIMPRPSNYLDRSPVFRQYNWQRAEELLPHLDPEDRAKFFRSAEDSNLGKKAIARMKKVKTVSGQPDKMLTLDQLTLASKSFAADQVKSLLYDLSERSQFFDMFRIVFPFGEAWKEVATRWARIAYEEPRVLRRAQQGVQGARGAGWFHKDPMTGQEVFNIPGTEWLTDKITQVPMPMVGSVEGLNMVSTGLPGVGPVVQIGAAKLIPNTPNWDWARNVMFPFGQPEDTGDPLGDILDQALPLPNFVTKMFNALRNPDRFRIQGNTVGWVMRYKASSGEYKLNGDNAEAEMRRLQEDSIKDARELGFIRAIVSSTAPSAPMPDWKVRDKDGNLVTAQVLVEDYHKLMEPKSEGGQGLDFDEALEVFVDRHGIDNILLTQAFSEPVKGFVPPTDKAQSWVQENPKLAEAFPDIYGLFAPGQNDEFSLDAYGNQFTRGERRALTPREMLEQANNRVAARAYSRDRDKLGDDANTQEGEAYLRDLREWYAKQYPGFNKEAFDYQKVPNLIRELERAVKSPLLKGNPALDALKDYMKERRSMVDQAEGGALGGEDDLDARDYLRDLGAWWSREQPAFRPIWENVFERELRE